MTQTDNTFHTKYRPTNLSELIGHEVQVTRLKGMIKTGKIPGALLFTGPSSVGKTTLARALASEINGGLTADYKELNAADSRTIDDMRELIKLSKFKPSGKKRIFVIDEAQQLLSNAAAAQAILKPMEDAGKTDTIWILCSMDPSKFGSGTGKAIANRCTQFVLEEHSNMDLLKQGIRITKGERMTYLDKDLLKSVVRASNSEMRTLANLIQGIRDYYEGLEKKPKLLTEEIVSGVLKSTESNDDRLASEVIVSVFKGEYAKVHKACLYIADEFMFVNKLVYGFKFLLDVAVLNGERHPKVWWSPQNRQLAASTKNLNVTIGQLGAALDAAITLKSQVATGGISPESISIAMYRLILATHKKKEG
jgi:DNA polymerase III gamma/tau subunit